MIFKKFPSDFYVEEIINNKLISKKGKYSLYRIKKINITTFEAIYKIANYFNVSPDKISFAGLKDKKSVSIQHFTLPSFIEKDLIMKNLEARFIGYSNSILSPSWIEKNFFRVVLRNVNKKEEIASRIIEIKEYGIPNYFDHQRLGHAIKYHKFIFEEIIKEEYEEALRIYFMSLEETGRKRLRKFKKAVKKYFGEWKNILKFAEGQEEKRVLKHLLKYHDTESAILQIPEYKLVFYAESYQSYLWNKALYHFLKGLGLKGYRARHKLNPFFFYRTVHPDLKSQLLKKDFPFPFFKNKEGNPDFIEILNEIEKQRHLKIKNELGKYLVNTKRSAIFLPEEIKFNFKNDNLEMSFYLPPGSYATVLLKSLVSYEKILKEK